jgi:hypothetical protein
MESTELPAIIYQASCKSCGALSRFTQFEASFYDFATYLGKKTGTIYRLNVELTDLKYGSITPEEALEPAVKREGGRESLLLVPDELECPSCHQKSIQHDPLYGPGREELVEAVELPVKS